jgi:hypothetical protein
MEIKIIIPDDKIDELKKGFKAAVEKPEQLSHLNDLQFFKQWLKDIIFNAYLTGKRKIAATTTPPEVDNDIITEVV